MNVHHTGHILCSKIKSNTLYNCSFCIRNAIYTARMSVGSEIEDAFPKDISCTQLISVICNCIPIRNVTVQSENNRLCSD